MIRLTEEEYNFAIEYLQLIEQIVKTSAASNIPAEFRECLLDIAIRYNWSNCRCNSAIYLATCRLYNSYLETKKQIEDEERRTTKEEGRKGKKTTGPKSRRPNRDNQVEQTDSDNS